MADKKITEMTTLTQIDPVNDYLEIVDTSETDPTQKNKKVAPQTLFSGVKLDTLAEPTDNTNPDVNTIRHGLMKKLSGIAVQFFNGLGNWTQVKDTDLSLQDETTQNATTTRHGFLPKLIGDATKFLNSLGNWTQVKDTDLSLQDETTQNATTTRHGFLPKLNGNSSTFLNGMGQWASISGGNNDRYAEYFPTFRAYRPYREVIPQSTCKEKEALPPNPNIETAGLQLAEYEDCSQIYRPVILKIGNLLHLYYAANTQKYKTNETDSEDIRTKSDFCRADRVFLAIKHVDDHFFNTPWQKVHNGTKPVLDIDTNIYGNGYDVGNAWLRSVIYSNILGKYIMAYVGDRNYGGSLHAAQWCFAESTDGVNWTKAVYNPISTIAGSGSKWMFGGLVEVGSYFYLFSHAETAQAVALYCSTNLQNWTLINSNILGTTYWCVGPKVIDDAVYIILMNTSTGSMELRSVPTANIENAASYTNHGTLISGNLVYNENPDGVYGNPKLVWGEIHKLETNRWVIFYSYYKNRFARYPYVRETGIRYISFQNSIPKPA